MCSCDDEQPERTVALEVRVRISDSNFQGVEDEADLIRETLETYYDVESVEIELVSDTDTSTGIQHYAGVEG